MKTLLFENVNGNQFKLIKESVKDKESLISSGLKKVFSTMDKSISYQRIEAVGLSYIKDITEAKRIALDEAKSVASQYGYKDLVNEARFIKENEETNTDAPAEKREVQIGRAILSFTSAYENENITEDICINGIEKLAQELIKMHGQ